MRYAFIQAHQAEFPLRRLCAVLDVSPSGYYVWRGRPASAQRRANQQLVAEIRAIHAHSRGTYGSPRVHAELVARGFRVGQHRVERLTLAPGASAGVRAEQIRGQRKTKRPHTTDSQHGYPIAPHRLQRDFQASRPNEKWLADLTYIPTTEGW